MQALEFSTIVNNGMIQLPQTHQAWENIKVRVILLIEKPIDFSIQKQNLRNVFAKMEQVSMFESIDNPVEWQKQLRDEWE